MLLLVSKAHPSLAALNEVYPQVGRLVVPKDCSRVHETAALGIPWAADNAAFSNFDEAGFVKMLDWIEGAPGCLFVSAPDVVADAAATLDLLEAWAAPIAGRGLPLALVLQDGLDARDVPWDALSAVFVGGSTEWKMGLDARELVAEAKRRGLHAHMGRVNTLQRIRYAKAIGCDSVDGSQWSRWTMTYIDGGAAAVAAPAQTILHA